MQNSDYPFITPSSTCLAEDLLFFDTFSHSGLEKDIFDLVQFPSPVVIDLIKIVPLGQPVEAKIPGNVRLGATNPSNCELEFFINDLTKQDAHTMTDLGKFYCSEKDTDFCPPVQIQTDGLLLRGSYRTLTLAIFGQIASYDDKVEDDQAMMSAASPPAQTPASPVASERDIPYIVRPVDQELLRRARDDVESPEDTALKSVELSRDDALIDNVDLSEDAIMDLVETIPSKDDLSGSDGGPSSNYVIRDGKHEEIEYSNSADTDNHVRRTIKEEPSSKQEPLGTNDDDHDNEDDLEPSEWLFEAESYQPQPLQYFPDPSLTMQEKSLIIHHAKISNPSYREAIEKESEKVKEMFDVLNCSDDSRTDDWVMLVEDLTNDIANMSLSQTISDRDMLEFLVKQILYGLDISIALRQKQTGFKVRHLKAGIKLATTLFHCGKSAVSTLLEASVLEKVLELYNRDQMSLPLRLLIFKCLNAASDNVEAIEHMIHHKYEWGDTCLSLADIKSQIMTKSRSYSEREELNTPLFDSVHSDGLIKESSQNSPARSPQKLMAEQECEPEHSDSSSSQSLTCYQYMVLILLTKPTTRVTIAVGNLIKKMKLYINLSKLADLNQANSNEDDTVFDCEESREKQTNTLEQCSLLLQDIAQLMRDGCISIAQPIRHLPASVQFQVKLNAYDTYLAVYRWLRHFNTLDSLNMLLNLRRTNSFQVTMAQADVEQSIRFQNLTLALIQNLLDSPKGAQFFLSEDCCDTTAALIQTLSNIYPPRRSSHVRLSDGIENCLSASLCKEESTTAACCRDQSIRMAYKLKVFSSIDLLFNFHRELINKHPEASSYDPERVLHHLFIISGHPYGLSAIVKYFSCIGNLDCLLRFLDVPDHHKHLEFVKETSIDYTLEILGTFLRLNNNVLEIAEEYLDTLLDLCKTKEKNLSVRIKSLIPWLNPFDPELPFPLITYSEDTFRQLTRVIRKSIPDCSIPFAKALDFELPPQMITAVRILRQLCIPPQVEMFISTNFDMFSAAQKSSTSHTIRSTSFMTFVDSLPHQQNYNQSWNLNLQSSRNNSVAVTNNPCEDSLSEQLGQISNTFKLFQPYDESICGELKYHYGIMQVFEQEGLKRLLNTLRELIGNYPRPIYQSAALSGFRGRIVLSYINSVIILLHSITCHLIDARGSDFKDTSIIPVILETYSLLCFVPKPSQTQQINKNGRSVEMGVTETLEQQQQQADCESNTIRSDNYHFAQQTKKMIISILMSYTQMCLSVSESEEKVISKSMWTKMLKEVIDFTLSTPVFFHHGLEVLTRILPSPLPCSSVMDSIDQEQLFKNINHRKLWSAHLHPLHQQIEQMISILSICYQSNIRALLYYLCNQLCDLSSNAACMVAKIITDTLLACAAKLSIEATTETPSEHNNNQQTTNQLSAQQQAPSGANLLDGTKESSYAVRMVLNLLSNLITNQAFETAFSNHILALGKKNEKLLANLYVTLKLHDDYKPGELLDDLTSTNISSVAQLIEAIKSINDNLPNNNGNNNINSNPITDVAPPEELTRINLTELARKTSDRSTFWSGLKRTYRLKVLLDLNSRARRSNDPLSTGLGGGGASASSSASKRFEYPPPPMPYQYPETSSSHKAYGSSSRSRNRSGARPDSFRSRAQNTSRPPSIHVDDFIDIYGDGASSNSRGFSGAKSSSGADYRSSSGRHPMDLPPLGPHGDPHRHSSFFGGSQLLPPPPPLASSGSNYGNRHGSKSKYMKLK